MTEYEPTREPSFSEPIVPTWAENTEGCFPRMCEPEIHRAHPTTNLEKPRREEQPKERYR